MTIPQAFSLATQHHRAGRLADAEALYRQILTAQPDHAEALHLLGLLAHQAGRHEIAVGLIQKAIALNPKLSDAHSNIGYVYHALGRTDEAIASSRRALELRPEFPAAHNNLGNALKKKGELQEAISAYREAVRLESDRPELWNNLGSALTEHGELDEAEAAIRHALHLKYDFPEAHNNLGAVLMEKGQLQKAIESYHQATLLAPSSAETHWNNAMALLSAGRWKEGWEEFEWRLTLPELARPDLTTPSWNGEDISGRTLLIHQEGGFGDVLHFIRYLPMIRARGGPRIIFEGDEAILGLMRIQPGIAETIARGHPVPAHDFHCAPQSFPRLFGTELHNVPAQVPYLVADQARQSAWRCKLSAGPYQDAGQRRFLVGINWAGSESRDQRRSSTLSTFGPLAQVPHVTFVSLQKGRESSQSTSPPPGMRLVDASIDVEDFSDLAALVSCLDAVVTVDTSVAHLAGALGIPTWILVPRLPDFRWMRDREDSPWYPSVRLFRQQELSSWEEPVQRMALVLQAQVETMIGSP